MPTIRQFEVLFDHAEPSPINHPAYTPYGKLGFPSPPSERPWTYSNLVQSLDGIVSFKGLHPAGSDISRSREDRWLMDLLRAHADAVILGVNTLFEETQLASDRRGPVYRIQDATLRDLRNKLRPRKETNIFVTGRARFDLGAYRVFDGDLVDTIIVTTSAGAARLTHRKSHPHVRVVVAGEGEFANLPEVMRVLRLDFGIEYLLCEGGPTLYGYMTRAGLVDERFIIVSPVEIGLFVPPEQQPSAAERRNPPRERLTGFMAPGFTSETAPWWRWLSCRRIENHQFSRYRRISDL
jgi:riboflavin biosynthesis pyrimidine reductase